jgi:RimJ/RimL family protein N-acetyltransferase
MFGFDENTVLLANEHCQLMLLSPAHVDELIEAVQDGELWQLWYTTIPHPDVMQAEIDRRLALLKEGKMLPFSIVNTDTDQIVGMTTFLNIEPEHKRLEIGGTWLRKSCHHTSINLAAKILLLEFAFEELKFNAVEFRTHRLNQQSRKAIEKLGAQLDGILRHHMIMPDGSLRDTCVYSIIQSEWPTIQNNLDFLLAQTQNRG